MERLDAGAELLRLAADLIERGEPVVDVEDRVLEPLRHHRAGELLPALGGHFPGGFDVLFLDGSVRFLKDTINSWSLPGGSNPPPISGSPPALIAGGMFGVYQALTTRAGGEVLSADQY